MLRSKYARDSLFEAHTRSHTLLKEWLSIDRRQSEYAAMYERMQEINAKLVFFSASNKRQKIDSSKEQDPNEEEIKTLQDEYEKLDEDVVPIEVTDEEEEVSTNFIPADCCDFSPGLVFVGTGFKNPLYTHKYKETSLEGRVNSPYYIVSIETIDYVYVMDEQQEGIGYLRLAFVRTSLPYDLPPLVLLGDKDHDNILFLTPMGINKCDIRELLRSSEATAWGAKATIRGACRSSRFDIAPPQSPPHDNTSSSSPPRRSSSPPLRASSPPPSTSSSFLKGPPPSSLSSLPGMSASESSMTKMFESLTDKVLSSATPHAVAMSAKEIQKSRAFLFNVTGTKDNVFALLGSAGDATCKKDSFLHDLLDRFHMNVGGSDAADFLSIPLAKDGKCIQALLLGKVPSGLTTVHWDPKLSYGSTRVCISHFLPSAKSESVKGFPFIPTTPDKLTRLFQNMSMTFQGLFDERLLSDEEGKGPMSMTLSYWKRHFSDLCTIAFETQADVSLQNVTEYRLMIHLQKWFSSLCDILAKPSSEVEPLLVGQMQDMPHDRHSKRSFEFHYDNVQHHVDKLFNFYFGSKALRELVREYKKGDSYTVELQRASILKAQKEILVDTVVMPPPKSKDKQEISSASSTSSVHSGSNRGGRGRGGGGRGGGGRGGFFYQQPYIAPSGPVSVSNQSVITSSTYNPGQPPRVQTLGCYNHLMHIYNPQSSPPCKFGASCTRLHPPLPSTDFKKLELLQQQLDVYKGQPDVFKDGAPNRVKPLALNFLSASLGELSSRLSLQGSSSSAASVSSFAPPNKG